MRILVTGGDGFVGRHLCAELVERGHAVTSLSRYPDRSVLPDEVASISGNVTEYGSIEGAFEGQDAVVNLVALSPLYQPPKERSHEDTQVIGTLNTVKAAREHGVGKLLHMSALGADATAPMAYFRAKAVAETVVRHSDLDWVMFRPSAIFGEAGHFLSFIQTVTTPYVTVLPGGGTTRFQPIWIGDCVSMFADAIKNDDHIGEIYELGGPQVLALATIAKLIYQAKGMSTTVYPVPMGLAILGFAAVDPISFIPLGLDQARALQTDNITDQNDIHAFGVEQADLIAVSTYLKKQSQSPHRCR